MRDFIRRARKDGSLKRNCEVRVETLLTEFGDGRTLDLEQFQKMQRSILDLGHKERALTKVELTEELEGLRLKQEERFAALEGKVDLLMRGLEAAGLLHTANGNASVPSVHVHKETMLPPQAGAAGAGDGQHPTVETIPPYIMDRMEA